MKFFDIVWKEVSLIKSQRIALLLIFIYPFLVIGLIGTAFTGIDVSQMKQNKVGVVNELAFAPDFTKNFSSLNQLTVIDFNGEDSLMAAIKDKTIVAGVRLTGTSKYEQIKAELYYDNSSLLASKYFLEIAKAMMQRITADLSQKELGKVWDTISQLAKSVDTENSNIAEFKAKLFSAGTALDSLEVDLNKIDFTEIDSALVSQQATISDFNAKNVSFLSQVSSFKSYFSQVKAMAKDLNSGISDYKADLDDIIVIAGGMDAALSESIADLSALRDAVPSESDRNRLDSDINRLQTARSSLASLTGISQSLSVAADELSDSGSSLNTTISRADALFAQVDEQSRSISATLGSSNATISNMSERLSVFKASMDEVKALVSESRISKSDIESKLDSSSALLSAFSGDIAQIKDIDPQVLAKPAVFYERKVFEVDPFGILVSNAAVIVLLLTCMLLTSILILLESNQNVAQRLALSPTSRVTLISGKIVGQLIVAWIETAIILFVAFIKIPLPASIGGVSSLGFGLTPAAPLIDIFIAITIIAFSFISLGVLISFFTKNQSTAILASLLVVVPMLFLSGVILPTEFMEPFMQLISSVLPLTLGNDILLGLIVKGLPLSALVIEIGGLFVFGLVVVVASVLKEQ